MAPFVWCCWLIQATWTSALLTSARNNSRNDGITWARQSSAGQRGTAEMTRCRCVWKRSTRLSASCRWSTTTHCDRSSALLPCNYCIQRNAVSIITFSWLTWEGVYLFFLQNLADIVNIWKWLVNIAQGLDLILDPFVLDLNCNTLLCIVL